MPQVSEFNWVFVIFIALILFFIFMVNLNFYMISSLKEINLFNFTFIMLI